jgi:hypothetical protein
LAESNNFAFVGVPSQFLNMCTLPSFLEQFE